MSVSLVGVMIGLPVALAIRSVMGQEKFDKWLSSADYPVYTNFKDMNEMKEVVKKTGYDVTEWMGSFKTHLTEKPDSYFLWEIRDDCVVAVMSKYDDETAIERFKNNVEREAGRNVFMGADNVGPAVKAPVSAEKSIPDGTDSKIAVDKSSKKRRTEDGFPTIYMDEELLKDILRQYHINILKDEKNEIVCEYDTYNMTFTRESEEEPFDLKIISSTESMKLLYSCINDMNAEYLASLQEKTYLRVKEQIKEEGMEIEEEKVLEDNSIVLTVMLD